MDGTASVPAKAPVPPHVPPHLVVEDFDFYAISVPDGDPQLAWTKVRDSHPPIFWTPRNGGHWVATRARDIERVQVEHELFSHADNGMPRGRRGMPAPPIDLDPPEHGAYRAVISPAFSPKAVSAVEATIRGLLAEVVDGLRPRGECEFVADVAHVLPITVFLRMMGLPEEDAAILMPLSHLNTQSSDVAVTRQARIRMGEYLQDKIEERKLNPRDDILSLVVHGKVNGQPLGEAELRGMCILLLAGGLDTVAAMLGFIARFLATSPEHQRWLREKPQDIPRAVDELMRRHGISNTARLTRRDVELGGVAIRADEQVQIPTCLYALDPDLLPDPLAVDFTRPTPIPLGIFGNGPRRCPGVALARLEIRVFLETWMSRIPEFQIKPGTTPVAKVGMTNAIQELRLSWTP